MTKNLAATDRRHTPRDTVDRYAVIAFQGADRVPKKLWFDHPVDALACAAEYLKGGYQVRLSDGCVEWFANLPRPSANGGPGAALIGPPQLSDPRTDLA